MMVKMITTMTTMMMTRMMSVTNIVVQRRHLGGGGWGAVAPLRKKKKRKKRKKKRKKRKKKKKKEKKKEGNYEWRQITTYKVLFFPIFQNSPVALKNKKKIWPPPRKSWNDAPVVVAVVVYYTCPKLQVQFQYNNLYIIYLCHICRRMHATF